MMKTRFSRGLVGAVLTLIAMGSCVRLTPSSPAEEPEARKKEFTPQEVSEIRAMLAERNPSTYRVTVPVYRNEKVIGSETIGTLPAREVERLASLKGIQLRDRANLQAILDDGGPSGGGGGGSTQTGPGSHINSQSGGRDVISRIELMTRSLNSSSYSFIH